MTTGIMYAVLAGAAFGIYQILNRMAGAELGVARGMVVLLATCVALSGVLLAVLRVTPGLADVSLRGWLLLAGGGLFHFAAGLSFIALSQHSVGAGRTGSLVGTTPLFATLTGFLILGEVVSWVGMLGILMIVGGAVLVSTDR